MRPARQLRRHLVGKSRPPSAGRLAGSLLALDPIWSVSNADLHASITTLARRLGFDAVETGGRIRFAIRERAGGGGFTRTPFASTSLGAEQPLLNSGLPGDGRDLWPDQGCGDGGR